MTGFLELHGCEMCIIAALVVGLTIGMWCGIELGKEMGMPRRDARGRFVKS